MRAVTNKVKTHDFHQGLVRNVISGFCHIEREISHTDRLGSDFVITAVFLVLTRTNVRHKGRCVLGIKFAEQSLKEYCVDQIISQTGF